jgi:hypothetical protein
MPSSLRERMVELVMIENVCSRSYVSLTVIQFFSILQTGSRVLSNFEFEPSHEAASLFLNFGNTAIREDSQISCEFPSS